MSGFLSNALPKVALLTGRECFAADAVPATAGQTPSQEGFDMYKLALALTTMLNTLSKTPVAASIYYSQFVIGVSYTPTPRGAVISEQSFGITGVNIPIGSVGGTDTLHVGLYNSAGVLVARSITAGVLAGTALTIQQIPLYQTDGSTIGPVTLPSGTYYIALQPSGTTMRFLAINSPIWPGVTGSQTGVAGTLAAITPPTTYTANLGPMASLY